MFNSQKKYINKKIKGVQSMLWDLEFKRFKSLEIREGLRKDYDQASSRLEILKTQIAGEKENPTMSEDERKRLEDQQVLLEKDIDNYKRQIDSIDLDVNGSRPTDSMPEGHQGIYQQLEALQQLKGMLQEYLKQI